MLLRRLYYGVKPFIPWTARMALRRVLARRTLRRSGDVWPILPSSSRPPAGWRGWPEGKSFAFILTHDVEDRVGLSQVETLARLEMEEGFRSSFNFVPEGDYRVGSALRNWLIENGFEVGVHGLYHDGKLYSSQAVFETRAKKINEYLREWDARGFRSPLMHHNLEWIHQLDIDYDASTFDTDPFEPQPDGVGTVFPYWISRPDGGGYAELPYTLVQDSTLFNVLQRRDIQTWTTKAEWTAAQGGMVLLNSHPDYMDFAGTGLDPRQYPMHLYRDFLRAVKSRFAGAYWHALPCEVADWIRPNGQRSVIERRRNAGKRSSTSPDSRALETAAAFGRIEPSAR